MKKTAKIAAMCVLGLALMLGPRTVLAHGVGYRRSARSAVALEFYYSTGEAMAYREARVYGPDNARAAFQTGRTDEYGRVSFVPAVSGDWRVEVRDEEGHRAEAVVTVAAENAKSDDAVVLGGAIPKGRELFFRAILGVSLIFNVAAFVVTARAKKRGARACT
jgi:nucleotide-binding universal stress UspA family protein